MPNCEITIKLKLMPTNSRHIPSFGILHQITLVSSGFDLGGPFPTSMNNCGLGDKIVCQA
jgi:hypothetical protein